VQLSCQTWSFAWKIALALFDEWNIMFATGKSDWKRRFNSQVTGALK